MAMAPSADPALAARLQPYLQPGESLVWSGKPDSAVVVRRTDLFAIPFSLVFLAIAIGFLKSASASGAGDDAAFELAGIVFVVIGCYLLVGRFFTTWVRKRRSVYAVTSDRVIALVGNSVSTAPVNTGSMSVRRSMSGRHATVTFEPFGSYYQVQPGAMTGPVGPDGMPTPGPPTRRRVAPGAVTFYDVPAPDALLAAVNQAKAAPLR